MSNLSVFWQIPQFMLIGVSEILASITSLEFFYSQAPSSMRSVAQAFNLATSSIGSFVVIPLIYIVNANPKDPWLPRDLNQGHLAWYFLLLAGLMVCNQFYFWYICRDYKYKTNAELQVDSAHFMRLSEVADVDPHTGHWSHANPSTGVWTHTSESPAFHGLYMREDGTLSDSGDLAMTLALLDEHRNSSDFGQLGTTLNPMISHERYSNHASDPQSSEPSSP
jgi:hypothetical protein